MLNFFFLNSISILNCIFFNLFFFFFKFFLRKKILFFFFARKKLVGTTSYYIQDLLKNLKKNYIVFYGVDSFFFNNKYHVILQKYFNYIFFVDIFLSNYLSEKVIKSKVRIYLHHDIYDTPIVSRNNERYLVKVLSNYNYIFVPSKSSQLIFSDLFNKYKNKSHVTFKIIKYPKIEYFYKNRVHYLIKNIIVIAPTNIYSFKKISLVSYLDKLITYILKTTNYKIVFRPHPSNINDAKINFYLKKFINNKRFFYDTSYNYQKTYSESKLMITDLSGTAYTYALIFNKPVIFFIPKTSKYSLRNNFNLNSNYFRDMNSIGSVASNFQSIYRFLKKYKNNKKLFVNRIKLLKKRSDSPFRSKKTVADEINKLFK